MVFKFYSPFFVSLPVLVLEEVGRVVRLDLVVGLVELVLMKLGVVG